MTYHNLLSKTGRACVAYIVAMAAQNSLANVQAANIYPTKGVADKVIGAGMVICDAERWRSDDGNPGCYIVETRIVVKTPGTNLLASEQFVSQVFDLFFAGVVDQDNTAVADAITTAGQALATSDAVNNGDMAQFKCDEVFFDGGSVGETENFWEDVLNLTLRVRAVSGTG
jgi:hypothetical protein